MWVHVSLRGRPGRHRGLTASFGKVQNGQHWPKGPLASPHAVNATQAGLSSATLVQARNSPQGPDTIPVVGWGEGKEAAWERTCARHSVLKVGL